MDIKCYKLIKCSSLNRFPKTILIKVIDNVWVIFRKYIYFVKIIITFSRLVISVQLTTVATNCARIIFLQLLTGISMSLSLHISLYRLS